MHDSLLYRFRGALLGAWLGEQIADGALSPPRLIDGDQATSPLIQPLLHQTARLAQIESIPRPQAKATDHPIAPIILTLPIALFYHDQPQVLQQAIQQHLPDTQPISSAWAIVLGQTLSLILRERLQVDPWLGSMLHWIDELADPTLMGQLQQVQHWLDQSTSLTTIAQWTQQPGTNSDPSLPILQALYSFLSTPNSFWLTLQRLQQFPIFTPSSGLIAGFLSGAYNGVTNIPQVWRQQSGASSDKSFHVEPAFSQHPVTEADLFDTADRLLAAWSGVDLCADWQPQELHHRHIIAAPRVLRLR